ncbi:sulfotransferase family 2 domain-containing protein [Salinimicrobium terrae]|uniref:sulfotransferase family 2 domain-containing protein n=1 Tax=Salinimicrobium terrae TaxID=470866 RepID=UPI0004189DD8|nr:sulfotransferase family 2 domain-containing protein [Salinimicrobium terrae]
MISHQYKCIFIHIPKTGGSSIYKFFHPDVPLLPDTPNYDIHYGWCPERKIYLQHATAFQLLNTGLVSEEVWKNYYKFTIVRNPWDRSYSDYLWAMRTSAIKDSFTNYITARGDFEKIFAYPQKPGYKGDHLKPQKDFFDKDGRYAVDYIGRFEDLVFHIEKVAGHLGLKRKFNVKINGSTSRYPHYSLFYNKSRKKLVEHFYAQDISKYGYNFEDKKKGLQRIKNLF